MNGGLPPDPSGLAGFVERLVGPKSPFELHTDQDGPHFRGGPQTLVEVYRRALRMGTAPLVFVGDETVSYADLIEPGLALAGALRRRDLQGRRIAVDLGDKIEWLRWFVAVTAAGASAVLVPADGDQGAVAASLETASCDLVVTRRDRPFENAENLLGLTPTSADAAADWTTDPGSEVLVVFTSGSTGVPKGVRHSQKGLLAGQKNMMLLGAVVGKLAAQPIAPATRAGVPTPLVVAPLHYIAGYAAFLLALSTGGRLALPRGAATIEEACGLVERRALTSVSGAGSDFIRRLLRAPRARESLRSLRRLQFHGAGLQAEIRREVGEVLPNVQILTGYGLTETCGSVASAPAALAADGAGGGWASPATAFRLAPANPPHAGLEQAGHLELRGDMIMLGYLNPAQNAAAFTPDGWFRTGDLGVMNDQGWLTILDRRDGLAEGGGRATPRSVLEGVVRGVEGVDEAVVDVRDGDKALRIVVQMRDGRRVSETEIARALTEDGLWTGAISVETRETLPSTASGKIDRSRVFS
jgi:acyl-CoA synthetase (AMP-forming)/AMP-acid ligase II